VVRRKLKDLVAIAFRWWDISKRFDFLFEKNEERRTKNKAIHRIARWGGGCTQFFALRAHRLPFRTVATTKLAECPASDSLPFCF
jgi:hypothetical protein